MNAWATVAGWVAVLALVAVVVWCLPSDTDPWDD